MISSFPVSFRDGPFNVRIRDGLIIKFERMGNDLWKYNFGEIM